jgi:hypothetical protein
MHTTDPDTNQQFEASTTYQISTRFSENEQRIQVKFAFLKSVSLFSTHDFAVSNLCLTRASSFNTLTTTSYY